MNMIFAVFKNISEHKLFDNIVIITILIAGIIVGLQTSDEINYKYGNLIIIIDYIVISIFTAEILINILAEGKYPWRFFYDNWHIFDFIIVALCYLPLIFPDYNAGFFAVFRLIRIVRIAKIFEKIQYFKLLLGAIINSFSKIIYVLVLLLLLYYIYGVIGTDLFGKYEPEFSSVFQTMKQLFFVSFEGWSFIYDLDGIKTLLVNGYPEWILVAYFISFLFISALILLNLFIGIITSEMDSVKQEEAKGKQHFYKVNHTLILGWSNHIYRIIEELIEANLSLESAYIVILSNKDKIEMDDELKKNIKKFKTTKIVCRSGEPSDISALRIVNAWNSKSVIILNESIDSANDLYIIKIIIALIKHSEINSINKFHIVADLFSKDMRKIANDIAGDRLILFDSNDFLSRLIVQSAISPKLTLIYKELISFNGNEIYLYSVNNKQINLKYADIIFDYTFSIVIGVFRNGNCIINPEMDMIIEKDDRVILISEDDSTIKYKPSQKSYNKTLVQSVVQKSKLKHKKNILVLGINKRINNIIYAINNYLNDSSTINVVSHLKSASDDFNQYTEEYDDNHLFKRIDDTTFFSNHIELSFNYGNIWEYSTIEKYLTKDINQIIVLRYEDEDTVFNDLDALSLLALMHIEKVVINNLFGVNITVEFEDNKNIKLVPNSENCDFVISSDLFSSALATLSEEPSIYKIYNALFQSEGPDICYRKATNLFKNGEGIYFDNIIESLIKQKETAIGYMKNNGQLKININPDKNQRFIIEDDDLIVAIADT